MKRLPLSSMAILTWRKLSPLPLAILTWRNQPCSVTHARVAVFLMSAMIDRLGVAGWGFGGIEAEATVLGKVYLLEFWFICNEFVLIIFL